MQGQSRLTPAMISRKLVTMLIDGRKVQNRLIFDLYLLAASLPPQPKVIGVRGTHRRRERDSVEEGKLEVPLVNGFSLLPHCPQAGRCHSRATARRLHTSPEEAGQGAQNGGDDLRLRIHWID